MVMNGIERNAPGYLLFIILLGVWPSPESGLNPSVNDETKVRHTVGVQTDIASQLTALNSLLDSGALSQSEYEAAKIRVLGQVSRAANDEK